MSGSHRNIGRFVEDCVEKLIVEYGNTSFAYMMEADIQARFYAMLLENREFFPLIAAEITRQISRRWGPGYVRSIVVHCEMPVPNRKNSEKRKHVDIGIWRESELGKRSADKDGEHYKCKNLEYAIEIKYNWQDSLTERLKDEIWNDICKVWEGNIEDGLTACIPNGYFLCFLARPTDAVGTEKQAWEDFFKNRKQRTTRLCKNIKLDRILCDEEYRLYIISPVHCLRLYRGDWHICTNLSLPLDWRLIDGKMRTE